MGCMTSGDMNKISKPNKKNNKDLTGSVYK